MRRESSANPIPLLRLRKMGRISCKKRVLDSGKVVTSLA